MSDSTKDVMAAIAIATEARGLRDAEWRAAVEDVRERIGTNSPYVDAALDALLRAMEVS